MEAPASIREIVEAARKAVGRERVAYHWQVFPETGGDEVKRIELILSLRVK